MSPAARDRRPVAVVTGGGGGIGAAIAEELGRRGTFVVTMDPLVSLDGAEQLPAPEETTAGRIVAAGGSARASAVSVTDAEGVRALFAELAEEHGGLDAVVNVAGITRPTGFAKGGEDDWQAVLAVHLDGYRNVLAAALPIMAAAGHGRILGVTSGSGWRAADAGAYSCAKRAVASLTWEIGQVAPPGVIVNALPPTAVTRRVTAALGRAANQPAGGSASAATGGLSLGSMPTPDQLGPLGAHLVSADFDACAGQVVFAGGAEVAVIDPPRLLEVVRTHDVASLPHLLQAATVGALAPAEAAQASAGGSNPRFGSAFSAPADGDLPPAAVQSCAVVTDRPDVGAAVISALEARGVVGRLLAADDLDGSFGAAAGALAALVAAHGPIDGIVVAPQGGPSAPAAGAPWERVLAEHDPLVAQLHADAAWARAAADHAAQVDRPVRLVTVVDATTAGGRSRAQAAAQLARAARRATDDRVTAMAVSVEAGAHDCPIGELAAHLVGSPEAVDLAGAELVLGAGWLGLRSHPRPGGSISFGGPDLPEWFDASLRRIAGAPAEPR